MFALSIQNKRYEYKCYHSSLAALYAYRTSDELGIGLRSLYSYMATGGYSGRRIRIEPASLSRFEKNTEIALKSNSTHFLYCSIVGM